MRILTWFRQFTEHVCPPPITTSEWLEGMRRLPPPIKPVEPLHKLKNGA